MNCNLEDVFELFPEEKVESMTMLQPKVYAQNNSDKYDDYMLTKIIHS